MSSNVRNIPIRSIKIVIDANDIFAPELTLEEFRKTYKKEPKPPRYRILNLEIITCAEDGNPILVTECGKCPRFIRRYKGYICCYEKHL